MKHISELYYTYDIGEYFKTNPTLTYLDNVLSILHFDEMELICCSNPNSNFNETLDYYIRDGNVINFVYTGDYNEYLDFYSNRNWLVIHVTNMNNYLDQKVKFLIQQRKTNRAETVTYFSSYPIEQSVLIQKLIKKTFLAMKLVKLVFY